MLKQILVVCTLLAAVAGRATLRRKSPINGRIVGGNETTIEKNPWQVSLEIFGVGFLHDCGGSIISEDTAITAGHCADPLSGFMYQVRLGTTQLSKGGVTVGIREVINHPQNTGFDYDVAILKLAENLTFSDQVQPVALPEQGAELAPGTTVTTTGWGVTDDGGIFTEDILRSVDLLVVDREECAQSYAQFEEVTDRMICAGVPEGGKDACQGDSGGPLTQDGVLYGVVSWGLGCGEAGYPGVYLNVASVRDWITEMAGV